ncbi:MAG: C4-dicarboxylate ABC transporter substrate-binding protein [Desulfuromonas sp.]|nr:MAG: C4-dicarboxylate ABC transporter substrate-binding protein [Desulfuromonas sp.]
MPVRNLFILVAAVLLLTTSLCYGEEEKAQVRLLFSGGPDGGTFQYFSNGISTRLTKNISYLQVRNQSSAGSVENIRRVNRGMADFGIVYAGDAYLARNGRLLNDPTVYNNTYLLAHLYDAPAHLLTTKNSGIKTPADLTGRKVAIGGAGSGAAASAERYFRTLGIWSQIHTLFIGYSAAATKLQKSEIDAMWVLAGIPNASIIQATTGTVPMRLIDTWEPGVKVGLFEKNPFYRRVVIPAGTYNGIDADCVTFGDAAFWVAGKQVKETATYDALADIYSSEGLAYMERVKSTARSMSPSTALKNITIPLHSGAIKFWSEQGLEIPDVNTVTE